MKQLEKNYLQILKAEHKKYPHFSLSEAIKTFRALSRKSQYIPKGERLAKVQEKDILYTEDYEALL